MQRAAPFASRGSCAWTCYAFVADLKFDDVEQPYAHRTGATVPGTTAAFELDVTDAPLSDQAVDGRLGEPENFSALLDLASAKRLLNRDACEKLGHALGDVHGRGSPALAGEPPGRPPRAVSA